MIEKNKTKGWLACVSHIYFKLFCNSLCLVSQWDWVVYVYIYIYIHVLTKYIWIWWLSFGIFGHLIKTFLFAKFFRFYSFTTDILIPSYPFENYVEDEPSRNQQIDLEQVLPFIQFHSHFICLRSQAIQQRREC